MFRFIRLWRLAGRDLGLLWFALRHPARPAWLAPLAVLLLLWALDPLNLVDPLLGFADDLLLLPMVLHLALKLLPPQILAGFGRRTA